jgi:hypothetical protein
MAEELDKWQKSIEILGAFSTEFLNEVKNMDPDLANQEIEPGKWTFKEMVAHIVGWEKEVAIRFIEFIKGSMEDVNYDINSFNKNSVDSRQLQTWQETIYELQEAQADLQEIITKIREADLKAEKRFQLWVNVLIRHYKQHLKQLK